MAKNIDLASLLNWASPTGSGKTTTSHTVDQAAANTALQSILSGTQGLASVTAGEKTAGMYNSNVNTMLVNQLLTDATAKVAALNYTDTATTKKNSQSKTNLALAGVAALIGSGLAGSMLGSGGSTGSSILGKSSGGGKNGEVPFSIYGNTPTESSRALELARLKKQAEEESGLTAEQIAIKNGDDPIADALAEIDMRDRAISSFSSGSYNDIINSSMNTSSDQNFNLGSSFDLNSGFSTSSGFDLGSLSNLSYGSADTSSEEDFTWE